MALQAGDTVLVVEDDDGMREAIETLLAAAGIRYASFSSAEALLTGGAPPTARRIFNLSAT